MSNFIKQNIDIDGIQGEKQNMFWLYAQQTSVSVSGGGSQTAKLSSNQAVDSIMSIVLRFIFKNNQYGP